MLQPELDCVFIETTTACTRTCPWCTRAHHPIKPAFMPSEYFMKILYELGKMNFRGRLSPFQNGEPLLDKRLLKWLRLSKLYCPASFKFIITNGDLLTRDRIIDLFSAGLDAMKVNTYDKAAFNQVSGTLASLDPPTLKRILFIDYSDKTDWTNRGGTIPDSTAPSRPTAQVCPRPFRQLYITWNGNVVQCCADYLQKNVMGHVRDQSLLEIWNGPRFKQVRDGLLGKAPLNALCRVCNLETHYDRVEDVKKLFSMDPVLSKKRGSS